MVPCRQYVRHSSSEAAFQAEFLVLCIEQVSVRNQLVLSGSAKESHMWLTLNIKDRVLIILSKRPNPYIADRSEITVSVRKMTSLSKLAVASLVEVPASRCFILKVYIRGATTATIC
jgi:hypothetical protein